MNVFFRNGLAVNNTNYAGFFGTDEFMYDSEIIEIDDKFVYAKLLLGKDKGMLCKIPKENVRPCEWIKIGEYIWCAEHNIWNFYKLFDDYFKKRIEKIHINKRTACFMHVIDEDELRLFENYNDLLFPVNYRYFIKNAHIHGILSDIELYNLPEITITYPSGVKSVNIGKYGYFELYLSLQTNKVNLGKGEGELTFLDWYEHIAK